MTIYLGTAGQWLVAVAVVAVVLNSVVGLSMLVKPIINPQMVRRYGITIFLYALVQATLVWLAVGATVSAPG